MSSQDTVIGTHVACGGRLVCGRAYLRAAQARDRGMRRDDDARGGDGVRASERDERWSTLTMTSTTLIEQAPSEDRQECHEHRWVTGKIVHPDRPATVQRCAECGAGHRLETQQGTRDDARLTLTIYPAASSQAAERRIVATAIQAAAKTMRDRERAGERVIFDAMIVEGAPIDDPDIEELAYWLASSSVIANASIDDAIERIMASSQATN